MNQLLKSGKRHCTWKFYYRNGQTKAVGKYADGELDGFWEWWRENGQQRKTFKPKVKRFA
jgi:antitoxin component YwqK of YwqJK toxin-antitoxin module